MDKTGRSEEMITMAHGFTYSAMATINVSYSSDPSCLPE